MDGREGRRDGEDGREKKPGTEVLGRCGNFQWHLHVPLYLPLRSSIMVAPQCGHEFLQGHLMVRKNSCMTSHD